MKQELRSKLDAYAVSKGWEPDDDIVMEILIEGKTKKEFGHDEHRWYTLFTQVVQIDEMFVEFNNYSNSGDEPALDGDEWRKMVFDSAKEVFPKTVETIDYGPATAPD